MIRIMIKKRQSDRVKKRIKSKAIIRQRISGTSGRPRLVVFRSSRHVYAQLVDDQAQATLLEASSLKLTQEKGCLKAEKVGKALAKEAKKKGIKKVVFDRGGYLYHGRIKAVAQGAREAGLVF